MGSTQVGRAIGNAGGWLADRTGIGGTAKDILKDPGRIVNTVATGGLSEIGNAVDNKLFNDPRNKAEDGAAKQAVAANKMLDEQQEARRVEGLTRDRDIQRARQRSLMSNRTGRSSTILTDPSAYMSNLQPSGYVQGRKQLLGM